MSDPSAKFSGDRGLFGEVTKALPRGLLEVCTEDGRRVVASLSRQARQTTVSVKPGERVKLSLSPYDPTRGQIEEKV